MRRTIPIKKSIRDILTEAGFDWKKGTVLWTHNNEKKPKEPTEADESELGTVCVLNPNESTPDAERFKPFMASDDQCEYRMALYLKTGLSGIFKTHKNDVQWVGIAVDGLVHPDITAAMTGIELWTAQGYWNGQECCCAGWHDVNLYVVAANESEALSNFVKLVNSAFVRQQLLDSITFMMAFRKLMSRGSKNEDHPTKVADRKGVQVGERRRGDRDRRRHRNPRKRRPTKRPPTP